MEKVPLLMPMTMEQFSCAAGDVAQCVHTPVTGTVANGDLLFRIPFMANFSKLWLWCDFTELFYVFFSQISSP